jgi:hypothetical protein
VKDHLEKTRHRWENIKMDLKERGSGELDWIHVAVDRDQWQAVVNMVIRLGFLKEFLD